MISDKEQQWLLFLAQHNITVELVFSSMDGELFVTPIVKTPEGSDDIGTYLVNDKKMKLTLFRYTKMLYRLQSNSRLNKVEQLLADSEKKIKEKVEYFANYIEIHEISKIGQIPQMLLSFGYVDVTKHIGNLSITGTIGYMGVDHHKKIFSFFDTPEKNVIGKLYRMKNALYLY